MESFPSPVPFIHGEIFPCLIFWDFILNFQRTMTEIWLRRGLLCLLSITSASIQLDTTMSNVTRPKLLDSLLPLVPSAGQRRPGDQQVLSFFSLACIFYLSLLDLFLYFFIFLDYLFCSMLGKRWGFSTNKRLLFKWIEKKEAEAKTTWIVPNDYWADQIESGAKIKGKR